ncbi:uncharacterized protein V6R79_006472 [Siganus canaliculatus]
MSKKGPGPGLQDIEPLFSSHVDPTKRFRHKKPDFDVLRRVKTLKYRPPDVTCLLADALSSRGL